MGGEEATNKEIEEIEEEASEHKCANDGSFVELFGSKVIFATIIACFIPLGQQMTGVNNYMTMSDTIYSNMGLDGENGLGHEHLRAPGRVSSPLHNRSHRKEAPATRELW